MLQFALNDVGTGAWPSAATQITTNRQLCIRVSFRLNLTWVVADRGFISVFKCSLQPVLVDIFGLPLNK